MKRALEDHDALTLLMGAGDVDGGLHCLGPGVHQDRLLREIARSELVEALGHLHEWLVGGDDRAHVDQLGGLLLERRHDPLRRVANRQDADAAGQVDELIAVDIDHHGAMGRIDADRGQFGVALRSGGLPASQNRTTLGAGNVGEEADAGGGRSHLSVHPGLRRN